VAEQQTDDRGAAWARLILTGAYLAYVGAMVWLSLPEHRRREIRMRAAARMRAGAALGARRAGVASMAEELRTGRRLYGLPYLLSRARDRAAGWYEGARS